MYFHYQSFFGLPFPPWLYSESDYCYNRSHSPNDNSSIILPLIFSSHASLLLFPYCLSDALTRRYSNLFSQPLLFELCLPLLVLAHLFQLLRSLLLEVLEWAPSCYTVHVPLLFIVGLHYLLIKEFLRSLPIIITLLIIHLSSSCRSPLYLISFHLILLVLDNLHLLYVFL